MGEVKPIIKYIIENNKKLQERGQYPVTIGIEGGAGIGKTSLLDTIAKELDCNYISINLSNITEPSDLVGYPIKEHYCCKGDECKWVPSELLESFAKAGWEMTEETRMSYAIPSWLKDIDLSKPTILNMDDFSRCQPTVNQAVMSLTSRQEYISWKLPKNSTIVLSSNPDNGEYQVTSMDQAQKSRYINFKVKFDIDSWADWAERAGIDGRAINFLIQNWRELMDNSKGESKVNARNFTMFANTISGIPEWNKTESLALILQIASGCFLDDDDVVGSLFTTFINNKLDRLLTPEEIATKDWKWLKSKFIEQVYDGDQYRADIASILTTRFMNFSKVWFDDGKDPDVIVNRIIEIVKSDKMILSEDLIFAMTKELYNYNRAKCRKMLQCPELIKKLI